jgi:hypothetical protein
MRPNILACPETDAAQCAEDRTPGHALMTTAVNVVAAKGE